MGPPSRVCLGLCFRISSVIFSCCFMASFFSIRYHHLPLFHLACLENAASGLIQKRGFDLLFEPFLVLFCDGNLGRQCRTFGAWGSAHPLRDRSKPRQGRSHPLHIFSGWLSSSLDSACWKSLSSPGPVLFVCTRFHYCIRFIFMPYHI